MKSEWENKIFWEKYGKESYYQERVELIKQLIPDRMNSILDIGVGKAEIINQLSADLFIVGLDISHEVQKYNLHKRLQASSTNIPVKSKVFDVSICLEVLEHLTDNYYEKTLSEIYRVTKSKIIIGVPYNENLNYREVVCPRCGFIFNADGHQKWFKNTDQIDERMIGFSKTKDFITGPLTYYPPNRIIKFMHRFGVYIPWEENFNCVNCGYSGYVKNKILISLMIKLIHGLKIFGKSYPYWLIIQYDKI